MVTATKNAQPSVMANRIAVQQLTFRGKRRLFTGKYAPILLGCAGVIVVLAAWQICAMTGIVDIRISSEPSQVLSAEIGLFEGGTIWAPLGNTAAEVGWAMLVILIVGIPLGLALGRLAVLRQMVDPIISILNSVPYVLFLPLIIFWFGLDERSRVLVVVWAGILPLIINSAAGVRNIDKDYLRVGNAFSVSKIRFFVSILLPASMPFILTGVRLAVARALVGAIVVEFFLSSNGLGFFVQNATSNFEMSTAMAGITLMAIAALLLTRLIGMVESRVISWSQSQ